MKIKNRQGKKQKHLTFCKGCGQMKFLSKFGFCFDCVKTQTGSNKGLTMNRAKAAKQNKQRGK